MDKIPFDTYDFFGYLASGLLLLVGMDRVFGFPPILGADLRLVDGAVLILAVYVGGQVVADPAKGFLENLLVEKILGRPNVNLFRATPPWGRLVFPGYFVPLPEPTRSRVLAKASDEGVREPGEGLFLHVRYSPATLSDEMLMRKLSSFLNKYGLARNLAFTSLLIAVGMGVKWWFSPGPELAREAIVAFLVGVLLLRRYLKFFRQYSYELFNVYAGRP